MPFDDPASVMTAELRFGMQPVKSLLIETPQRVSCLWLQAQLPRLTELARLAERAGVRVQTMPKFELEKRLRARLGETETLRHQGVVAVLQEEIGLSALPVVSFDDLCRKFQARLAEKGHALVIVLDGVTDPRNIGAILRVADGAGALGVIIPKHGSASAMTSGPIMAKASAGADVTMPLVTVTNLARALEALKKAGGWVVAADCSSGAKPLKHLAFPKECVLLMGSEGTGIRRLVGEQADFRVSIPMLGHVSSLNVSVACGILAYGWVTANAT